jgi:hypothetical protein
MKSKTAYFKKETARLRDARIQKYQKIQGLEALLAEHEQAQEPDINYIRRLRARIRSARCQFENMRGDLM